MPYISEERREEIEWIPYARNVGELTYILTKTILDYVPLRKEEQRFHHFAEVLGALRATELEFYRRVVAPYEDKKIAENGDVY